MVTQICIRTLVWVLVLLMAVPLGAFAQQGQGGAPGFKQEELDQMVAPIALYPDSLIAQIFMASTYPLEIVEAARWVKTNPNLKGDPLTAALEKQNWDPSVKSLVNFPSVLTMMNDKLEWTQKLGNAFLSQQSAVMDTVQSLRAKAHAQGTLKTTKEQKVIVQEKTIIIEPANPQVIYVPTYNPVVVYGAWPYPAYPPAPVYPPGYAVGAAAFSFAAGAAVGAAWGYAWGSCNWGHGGGGNNNVSVNVNQNNSINNNINRNNYANKIGGNGQGQWQHDPDHRKGVAYANNNMAQKYGQTPRGDANARQDYRGHSQDGKGGIAQTGSHPGGQERPGASPGASQSRGQQMSQQSKQGGAFEGMGHSGSQARAQSDRGSSSRESMGAGRSGGSTSRSSGFSRPSGGGGHRR
ncbi:MAG: DUF3300 domain-containing protein [Syntrophus sp. (in: bacteria)]|nr:DUF3300 domain-containing protein [Syntrophus sp. (in: bacteria)]